MQPVRDGNRNLREESRDDGSVEELVDDGVADESRLFVTNVSGII